MTDALDAVIDALLERALLDPDDARRYFALAGALERGRSAARRHPTGPRRRESPAPDSADSGSTGGSDPLGAALVSTAAIGALAATDHDGIDPAAWSPGARTGRGELVAVGAAAACRRFDVDTATVAARSGLPAERLAGCGVDGNTTTEPK